MSIDYNALTLNDNIQEHRFEMPVGDHIAFLEYQEKPEYIALIHTEVPEALEGQGIAAILVEKVLTFIREQGKKILPLCSYVQHYLSKHPEWNTLVH